jgi:hypothetical protein
LQDYAKSIVDSAKDVADSLVSFGAMVAAQAPENAFLTAQGYVQSMQQRVDAIQGFTAALMQLQKLNLNKTVFADIVKAGPLAGRQMAETLIAGGKEAVNQINAVQAELEKAAGAASGIYTLGTTGQTLDYAKAQAGMTVNFTKDSINISVGAGASAADAAAIRKVVVAAVRDALNAATKAERNA